MSALPLPLSTHYRVGDMLVQPAARLLFANGREIRIGGRAFDLLMALIERHGRVVSSNELYDVIWPGLAVEPNNLQVQVWALRRVLGRQALITVPRRGYQLVAPVQALSASPGLERVSTPPPATGAGRQAEAPLPAKLLAPLLALLQSHRLITLTGGTAATRLLMAQALSERLAPRLAGGAWRVQFPAPGSASVSRSLTRLGLLAQRIAPHAALMVLEECTLGLSSNRAALAAVIDGAPDLLFLATSPLALGVPGEGVHGLTDAHSVATAPAGPEADASGAGWLRWQPRTG
ncbi:MAG: hypothetical protein RJA98_2338 [Pseudomonadota bacterium]|jgi:DNA-binding winged helix-turn-helix (wHTH) protein